MIRFDKSGYLMKSIFYSRCLLTMFLGMILFNCSGGSYSPDQADDTSSSGSASAGERNPVRASGDTSVEIGKPQFVVNLPGQTSWYASPLIVDLDDDGRNEPIAAYYSVFVYDSEGTLLDRIDGGSERIYAPHVVADLEGDAMAELLYGYSNSGYLIILGADGSLLHDIPLPNRGHNGNGKGWAIAHGAAR